MGRAFHAYLSRADTEIFTTLKKFTDPEGKYKGIFDHRVYFLVHEGGQVSICTSRKTFGEIIKKDHNKMLFVILMKASHTYRREEICEGTKENVVRYGLNPFHIEYNYLDNEYWMLNTIPIQGSTKPFTRSLFPHNLIRDWVVQRQKDLSLTDITGDSRFLKLLPEKSSDFYSLNNFYGDFTNFNDEKEDFFRFHGLAKGRYTPYSRSTSFTAAPAKQTTSSITCQYSSLQKKKLLDKISKTFFTITLAKTTRKFSQQLKKIQRRQKKKYPVPGK